MRECRGGACPSRNGRFVNRPYGEKRRAVCGRIWNPIHKCAQRNQKRLNRRFIIGRIWNPVHNRAADCRPYNKRLNRGAPTEKDGGVRECRGRSCIGPQRADMESAPTERDGGWCGNVGEGGGWCGGRPLRPCGAPPPKGEARRADNAIICHEVKVKDKVQVQDKDKVHSLLSKDSEERIGGVGCGKLRRCGKLCGRRQNFRVFGFSRLSDG